LIYPVRDIFMEYPSLTPRQLAQVLKGLRKDRKMTQAQAAALVGLLPKTVSSLESDPEPSSIASLYKLLSALDLELVIRPKAKSGSIGPRKGEW
jgi:HTH-type transcriptional regulator / antitoxin HipB